MAKEVILTPIAQNDLENVVQYLISEWGLKVADNFISLFEKINALLADSPAIFPYFDKARSIQKCVVTKHNVLYFKEGDTTVNVITIFDTRQDPEKLSRLMQ